MTGSPALSSSAILVRVFLPFAAGYFLSYLYRTINAVLSPHLAADLRLDAGDLGLLTSVYFLTFAAFQLPLGLLLDRFGPRRVEATLLLFAAAGAGLFAFSANRIELLVGRGLIGLGVSACLMASLKAFVLWFPVTRLPVVNGWILAAGGLGALAATTPVEMALKLTDWRGVFAGLAVLSFMAAAALFLAVPERSSGGPVGDWREQWRGLVDIYCSPVFWRIAPSSVLSQATFLAIQGLWAGPWLRDVAGLDKVAAAGILFWIAAAMVAGFLSIGQLAYRLSRRAVPPLAVTAVGMALFMGVQLALLFKLGPILLLWVLFGFIGTVGTLSYAILTQAFPPTLAGRVNTALNVLVFVVAFTGQWGMGAIINHWPVVGNGYAESGYQWAFGLALMAQLVTWVWLLLGWRRK
ncbi:MAG: MFS transporter [Candidatus Competibacteraceae bacterium]|uniref:Permease of the major facilitator superfamily n=1 Tax=Candidatus Contendobacter odensis Run_B_J11 TaxID=1400861 RepID=A0A7U7J3N5_9GAMM|nr:MFS transporter [Candidatus Contendobacter odensis]MBK8534374.1 MFS transporter [Candidatus Competibacteraceae bacterium]MBK8751844.1 MFS transporter [Candidatus Competibacteraceae bacterium]CDH44544.1 Permease of the major facilitator superfamily [Candidatus Contendobacter odensis Run_B_J11]